MTADLHAPFRARAARTVTWVLGVLTVLGAVAVIVLLPLSGAVFGLGDQAGTAALAALICWFLWRQGSVRADPGPTGLRVRNLVHTRQVDWAEIVAVTFGEGNPWVLLDLSDGDTLAVMAIQRADGDRARAEARRLATLVALHEPRD
ncbi:PH domain-containing protein [Georgenia sp. TF02-10]|uniref:PH domain-containing protein n=1 Tax=Georgenia sp. TF02-10 TaxID=2917725 RepID=UPI001FA71480|nr:PH domain-containing protein [Georgenia sp. TF02-10]UNX53203.1 PH domain-containing protein [Georgenia sp. TF02-10]